MRQNSSNAETGFFGSISSSSIKNLLLPKSTSSKHKKPTSSINPKFPNSDAENTPPSDPNILTNDLHQSQPKISTPISHTQAKAPQAQDPPVKVVVRIRPESGNGEWKIEKVSSDTLCVGDKEFTFDGVFDPNYSQEDVFQSVGVPLVRNALAGYNTSVLSYGQSGSGKSYTMWGPPSSMVEEPLHNSHQGLAPRILRLLFTELEKEKRMSDQKQFNYQCRCSFLEIYDEQIGNLLNPIQQKLELSQMKDDSKNAFYIEKLIEEYVSSYDDVAQLLIKGLSSRKVGASSLNSNNSRSHIIFTFIIESWCKQGTSKGFSSSKTSRISLIDLAGVDGDNVDDAGSQYLRESISVKKSLSELGHLVDALTSESQSEKDEDIITHRNSCLTRLLQDSLGGNAKLAVICSISPDNRSNGETLSTLRFGQQVRSLRNEPVINETKEHGIDLSETIRHLKNELIRAKAEANSSVGNKNGGFQGRNVQESLDQLRVSLNRSLILHHIDTDTDDKINFVNEDDIRQLRQQIDELDDSLERNPKDIPVSEEDCVQLYSVEESCDAADMTSDDEAEKAEVCYGKSSSKPRCHGSISVSPCNQSPILEGPQLSESPKFRNNQRKSMAASSSYLASWKAESCNFGENVQGKSRKQLRSSKAESLAASLQKGLQIIDYHKQNTPLNKSSTSFSFECLPLTQCHENDMAESSNQTMQQKPCSDEVAAPLVCSSCWTKISVEDSTMAQDSLKSWMETAGKEKELEKVCKEQAARIERLNQLVEKLKGGKELNSIVVYDRQHEEYNSMKDEDKFLRGSSLNGYLPCIIEEKCEIKEVQEELAQGGNSFDATEKESLLKEIQNLRSKLQSYSSDAPVKMSTDKLRSSLMSRSIQLQKSGIFSHDNSAEELENERQRWTEMESEWICLTDELRVDLESHRKHAERVEMELRLEKKNKVELDDALERAVIGNARMVEHYAELQEKYNDLVVKHEAVMEGIAEVKKAAAKASKKGHARFAKSLAAELSAMRVEKERESKLLKKENQSLKIQLRDTAEAVQAAGELLVRLREAEHAAYVAEENFASAQEDNEKLKMQIEKLKRKHMTEISTMKQYLSESKLPESALQPLYREDSDVNAASYTYDDQAWRAEFGATYQEHF